jgi:uncharacterized protein (AIM24 family)
MNFNQFINDFPCCDDNQFSSVLPSILRCVFAACDFDSSPTTACCSGMGCCRQKMTGEDSSVVFVAGGGTIVYRRLEANETIIVDTRSILGFEDTVTVGITPNGRCCTCLFGGECCFSTTLTGPGKIFMQVC